MTQSPDILYKYIGPYIPLDIPYGPRAVQQCVLTQLQADDSSATIPQQSPNRDLRNFPAVSRYIYIHTHTHTHIHTHTHTKYRFSTDTCKLVVYSKTTTGPWRLSWAQTQNPNIRNDRENDERDSSHGRCTSSLSGAQLYLYLPVRSLSILVWYEWQVTSIT